VSSVPDFIYTFDLAGRFHLCQSLLDLWQKPFAEVVGTNWTANGFSRSTSATDSTAHHRSPTAQRRNALHWRIWRRAYEYIFRAAVWYRWRSRSSGRVNHATSLIAKLKRLCQSESAIGIYCLSRSIEGFCVVEMLFDANDTPINYRFLKSVPSSKQQTGLRQTDPVKRCISWFPDLEDHWIKILARIALNLFVFECAEAMNRSTFMPAAPGGQKPEVAIVFKDISDRKRIEAEREQI